MNKSVKISLVLISIVIGIGALYFYADGQVTDAINHVYHSVEYLDYSVEITSLHPLSGKFTYIVGLRNPTNIDVELSYYADILIEDEYISTLEFDVSVPANEFVTIRSFYTTGAGNMALVQQFITPTYHYYGQMKGSGKYLFFTLSKSWTDEWYWTQS